MDTSKLFFRIAPAILALIAVNRGSAQTLSESGTVHFVYDLSGKRVPKWSGGYLIPIENPGLAVQTIHAIDLKGNEVTPVVFTIPDTNSMEIKDVGIGADGRRVVCGQAYDKNGSGAGFVGWISPDGQNVKTVRLFPFVPFHLAVDADGSTWLQGVETVNLRYSDPAINPNHGVVRHFDRSGVEIGSYIPRSKIPRVELGLLRGELAASNGRVGWYADTAHVYYEVAANGTVSSFPGFAPSNSNWRITGLVLLEDGDAIVSAEQRLGPGNNRTQHMFRFDRAGGRWAELSMPTGTSVTHPHLLGGDGARLAMSAGPSAVTFLTYSR